MSHWWPGGTVDTSNSTATMHGQKRSEYKSRLLHPETASKLATKAQQWNALSHELLTQRRRLLCPPSSSTSDDATADAGAGSSNDDATAEATAVSSNVSNTAPPPSAEILVTLTEKMLTVNPDPSHLWNIRREMLLFLIQSSSSSSNDHSSDQDASTTNVNDDESKFPSPSSPLALDIQSELKLTAHCLHRNPKSYSAWYHRKWALVYFATHPSVEKELQGGHIAAVKSMLESELQLCAQFLQMDERNFHCWNYRRFVVALLGSLGGAACLDATTTTPGAAVEGTNIDENGLFNGSWSSWLNQSESEDWMGAQLSCGASSAMGLVPSNVKGKPSNGSIVSQQISPLSKTELEKLITTEWDFTTSIIQDNFSNGSAFHYRSKLLPLILESRLAVSSLDGNGNDGVDDEQKEDPGTSYKKRCEVILNMAREEWDSILLDAIFTEPDNQTLWWYHRFIVSWSKPKINAENDDECYREMVDEYEWLLYDMADSLRELLEVEKENGMAGEYSDVKDDTKGAKCKWAYLGLHLVLSSLLECRVSLPTGGGSPGDSDDREVSALREEAEECLKALTRIDPNRRERYQNLALEMAL